MSNFGYLCLAFVIIILVWMNSDKKTHHQTSVHKSYDNISFHGYDCLDDCGGHEAGYEWAEENDISDEGDCDGNSESFNEGCRAYVEENY